MKENRIIASALIAVGIQNTPYIKKLRVVTTITYSLKN